MSSSIARLTANMLYRNAIEHMANLPGSKFSGHEHERILVDNARITLIAAMFAKDAKQVLADVVHSNVKE